MAYRIGLDLGTSFTRIWVPKRGIVLRCPSVAAIDEHTGELVAMGGRAHQMLGKTTLDRIAVCPIKEGMVSEFFVTAKMLRAMFQDVRICSMFSRPDVLLAVPLCIDEARELAARNAVLDAGGRSTAPIPAIYAAAVGAGLHVDAPCGCMVLDIGGSLAETAIISAGGIIASRSIKVGGACLDSIITKYLQKEKRLIVGMTTAEELRIKIGSCMDHIDRGNMIAHGCHADTGMAFSQEISSNEICATLTPAVAAIAHMVTGLFQQAPPSIAADIYAYGIMLTGGCTLMPGMTEALARETGLRVTVAEQPQDAVIRGLGWIIRTPRLWEPRCKTGYGGY